MLDKSQVRQCFPRLETDRLILRKVEKQDQTSLYDCITNPMIKKYIQISPNTMMFAARLYRYFEQSNHTLTSVHFALTLKSDGQLIGLCSLQHWNESLQRASIGYMLSPTHWNRGIATEAVQAVMSFGFNELGLHEIQGLCDESNVASQRVMQKCGMRLEEGIVRRSDAVTPARWVRLYNSESIISSE